MISQLATVVFAVYTLIALVWFISFRPASLQDLPSCVLMALFWPVAWAGFIVAFFGEEHE